MARYIDADDIMKFPIRRNHCDKKNANEHFIDGIETLMEYIGTIPIADVAPVKHGKWMFDEESINVYCSACKRIHRSNDWKPKYCPNCGAVMEGEYV